MSEERRIAVAITNGETTFTRDNGEVVELPTPQRCGTETQRMTYAILKAREIIARS